MKNIYVIIKEYWKRFSRPFIVNLAYCGSLLSLPVAAQTSLAKWEFTGLGGSAVVAAYNKSTDISSTNLETRFGTGLTAINYIGDGFTALDQTATTLSKALTGGEYISFKISPVAGKKVSISSINVRPVSQNNLRSFTLFSSKNGFASDNAIGTFSYSGNMGGNVNTIAITGHNDITTETEFRIYIYGINNQYESVGFGNSTGDDLEIMGTTQSVSSGSGFVYREVWNGIGGISVSDIPTATIPTSVTTIYSLEGPTNVDDNYGTRIRGYINPPTSGAYTFRVAGDDNTELYLSTNNSPTSKTRIAYVPGWSNSREWNKYAEQTSAAINLTAGQNYYVEVLQKEGSGGDNVSVGWTGPGISSITVVPGSVLSPYSGTTGNVYTEVPFDKNVMPEVQLGLGGSSYYTPPVFANALYIENRGWMDASNYNSITIASGQLDANGYPKYLNTNSTTGQPVALLAQPGQNSSQDNEVYYRGRVVLTWQGEADIQLVSATCISGNCSGSLVNGRRVYTTSGVGGINGYTVKIFSINASNHPTKIRAWMPDPANPWNNSLEPVTGQPELIWHPSYVAKINIPAFGIYRFMDLFNTNGNPMVNWSDRRGPDHSFQTSSTMVSAEGANTGISYESAVALCNLTGKHMWINVPHMATDDFVKQMADLIRDNLNPNLKVYIEYSNEIWACAGGFPQGCYANTQAANAGVSTDVWIARRFAMIWSIFQQEFYGNARLVRVITSQTGSADRFATVVPESINFGATLNPPSKPDVIAPTTYFGNDIQRYVFEKLNWKAPTSATYDSTFVEWENRILSDEASQTGRDFTGGGGGFPASIVTLSNQYNLPIIPYEGGTGLTFADFIGAYQDPNLHCKTYTYAGAPNSDVSELACLAGSCSGGDCNGSPYHNFIYALTKDQRLYKMFYLNSALGKAKQTRTLTQFGDFGGASKYGTWGFADYFDAPMATSPKYKFWIDWASEQSTIREIGSPQGNAPLFTTDGELLAGIKGSSYAVDINFTGGDGTLTPAILGSGFLPAGCSFQYQTNKVRITGTPTQTGIFRFLVRILDGDNDPAYSVFTLRILPAPKNVLLAHEPFGTVNGASIQGSNNGFGFNGGWNVQNDNTSGFTINTSAPLSYSGLYSTGSGYFNNPGPAYLTLGRNLNVAAFDYLASSSAPNYVGQTRTSLWTSALIRRAVNSERSTVIKLGKDNSAALDDAKTLIIVGVNSSGFWYLGVRNGANNNFDYVNTTKSAVTYEGQTALVVTETRFGKNSDTVRLYINPTQLGGSAPSSPDAFWATTGQNDILINNYGFYGGSSNNYLQVDDIRMGDTYKAVTPTAAPRVGAEETFATSDNVLIYPNPASGLLNVNTASDEGGDIVITDMGGRILTTAHTTSRITTLSLTQFNTGIYLITVKTANGVSVKKLSVE